MQHTKKTNPRKHCEYFQGFSFFYGEINRLGQVTVYSSPSSHLHRQQATTLANIEKKKDDNISISAPPSCTSLGAVTKRLYYTRCHAATQPCNMQVLLIDFLIHISNRFYISYLEIVNHFIPKSNRNIHPVSFPVVIAIHLFVSEEPLPCPALIIPFARKSVHY